MLLFTNKYMGLFLPGSLIIEYTLHLQQTCFLVQCFRWPWRPDTFASSVPLAGACTESHCPQTHPSFCISGRTRSPAKRYNYMKYWVMVNLECCTIISEFYVCHSEVLQWVCRRSYQWNITAERPSLLMYVTIILSANALTKIVVLYLWTQIPYIIGSHIPLPKRALRPWDEVWISPRTCPPPKEV